MTPEPPSRPRTCAPARRPDRPGGGPRRADRHRRVPDRQRLPVVGEPPSRRPPRLRTGPPGLAHDRGTARPARPAPRHRLAVLRRGDHGRRARLHPAPRHLGAVRPRRRRGVPPIHVRRRRPRRKPGHGHGGRGDRLRRRRARRAERRRSLPMMIPLVLGHLVRVRRSTRQALAEQEARHDAETAVLEERQRIARELHDVVAHHMSVIAIQAEAAPYKVTDPRRSWSRASPTSARARSTADRAAPRPGRAAHRRRHRRPRRSPGWPPGRGPRLGARRRLTVDVSVSGEAPVAAAGRRAVGVPHRAGGAEQRDEARAGRPGVRRHRVRRRRAAAAGGQRSRSRSRQPAGIERWRPRSRRHAGAYAMLDGGLVRGPAPDGGFAVTAVLPYDEGAPHDPRADRRRPGMVRSGFSILLNAQPDIEVVGEAVNGEEAVAWPPGSGPTSSSWTCGCR